jgi:plasmid stabilization system protein ParE
MAFRVLVNIRAQSEIEHAFDWYQKNSPSAAVRFLDAVESAYSVLSLNPYFQIRYRNVRAIGLRQLPYSLYFLVDETHNTVKVLSCFHQHRSPSSRP